MKKFKIFATVLVVCLMIGISTFTVYALTTKTFSLPDRTLSFTAGENTFFDAEISFSWAPDDTITFGIDENGNVVGNNTLEDSVYKLTDTIPDINFNDTTTVYTVTYSVTNTGDKDLTFKLDGIKFDTEADQRFTTKMQIDKGSEIQVDNDTTAQTGFEKGTDTCSGTVVIPKSETKNILVSYQLARVNNSFTITEAINMTFSVGA